MDRIQMLSSILFFIWFVALPSQGTSHGLASEEPTHALVVGNDPASLKFAPIGSWDQFQSIPVNISAPGAVTVGFDPVEQLVYWGDFGLLPSLFSLWGIWRCKLDGSQVERVIAGRVNSLAIDPVNRRMYYTINGTDIESANLDGTGRETILNNGSFIFQGIALDLTNSRVYWSEGRKGKGVNTPFFIGRVNTDGSGYTIVVEEEDGLMISSAVTVDEKGARMYWFDVKSKEIASTDLDGNDKTVHVMVTDIGLSDYSSITFYKDQLLVTDESSRNVVVFNVNSGSTTIAEGEAAPNTAFRSTVTLCLFYKYDSPPPILGIKVLQTVAYHGGLIARINVPIEGLMASWTLEITFPRQVFDLKIFGCDVQIQDKSQTKPGGQRLGTKYILTSTPGGDIPTPGSRLRFKIRAEIYKKIRGFSRAILADFYPVSL